MTAVVREAAAIATASAAIASVAYVATLGPLVLARRRRLEHPPVARARRVSILKPLCGDEPGLAENLRSFCREAGPEVEILFGARDRDDAALLVARQVVGEFPHLEWGIAADGPSIGLNAKINTLAHLASMARYETLVIADSDTRVTPGYLQRVVGPLLDSSVGVVTCLFRSRPTKAFWSRFSALGVDEWFMPSVLVSRALQSSVYCSGPTMSLRREVLEAVGGFEALGSVLADDYELGARARQRGYRNVLADGEVTVTVDEPTWATMVQHELRWMRTIRTVAPLGHAFSFLTYAVPLTLLAAIAAHAAPWSLALVGLALAFRVTVHRLVQRAADGATVGLARPMSGWLVPLRDCCSFGVWLASYASRDITWRGQAMRVRPNGRLEPC